MLHWAADTDTDLYVRLNARQGMAKAMIGPHSAPITLFSVPYTANPHVQLHGIEHNSMTKQVQYRRVVNWRSYEKPVSACLQLLNKSGLAISTAGARYQQVQGACSQLSVITVIMSVTSDAHNEYSNFSEKIACKTSVAQVDGQTRRRAAHRKEKLSQRPMPPTLQQTRTAI